MSIFNSNYNKKKPKINNNNRKCSLFCDINNYSYLFSSFKNNNNLYQIKGDILPLYKIEEEKLKKYVIKNKELTYQKSINQKSHFNSLNYIPVITNKNIFISRTKLFLNLEKKYEISNIDTTTRSRAKTSLKQAIGEYNIIDEDSSSEDSQDSDDVIIEGTNNRSKVKRKMSEEFLINLYDEGVAFDPLNLNKVKDKIKITKTQKEKFKLEENNPYLYSFTKLHPFSVLYGTKYKGLRKEESNELKIPAPRFIKTEEWMTEPDYTKSGLLKNIKINNAIGLMSDDPEINEKFKGLLGNMIWQILQVPFGHHISLQIKMFEPSSIQQRYTTSFSFANKYLLPASDPNINPYQRIKYCIAFLFSGLYIPSGQLKPFNPFLGETFQGELPNGAKLYIEQVTHKPLAARFLMTYKSKYEISGYFIWSVKSEKLGNTMRICQEGPVKIRFPEINECIITNFPEIVMLNATSEEKRATNYSGSMTFVDSKNNYKAIIKFFDNKKVFHENKGVILKYKYPSNYKYSYEKEWNSSNKMKIDYKNKNNYKYIETIKGSYLNNLYIGNDLMWDINKDVPEYIKPVKNCLPSDNRYREDLIWLYRSFYSAKNKEEKENYQNIGQEWKIMLEEFVRYERKLRSDYKKSKLNKK